MGGGRNTGNGGATGDGVSTYPADEARLETYAAASRELAQFQAPVLLPSDDGKARLFVAAFDGTGNDSLKDPAHATNVANLHDQTVLESNRDSRISAGYMAGPGTQSGYFTSTLDSATGRTYDQRLEGMYKQFIEQAYLWKQADPEAKISVADIGFSRGAEQAAGFARMVHERGIQDPTNIKYSYNSDGLIKGITFIDKDKPPLVPPGKVPQVEGLFDAVGTGEPQKHDRRPPPSVISGLHIIAEDERRGKFKVDHIIPPRETDDGRFLGLTVAGAHSDIGGSYRLDGLSTRSNNLMIDYLNSLSDRPFLEKRAEPTEERLNVVHRSEEGNLLFKYGSKVDRREDGFISQPPAEPRDRTLSEGFHWRQVTIGPVPQQQAPQDQDRTTSSSDLSAVVGRMREAMDSNNSTSLHQDMQALASSSSAQTQSHQARTAVDQQPTATPQRQTQSSPAQGTDQQQSPQLPDSPTKHQARL